MSANLAGRPWRNADAGETGRECGARESDLNAGGSLDVGTGRQLGPLMGAAQFAARKVKLFVAGASRAAVATAAVDAPATQGLDHDSVAARGGRRPGVDGAERDGGGVGAGGGANGDAGGSSRRTL